jgi:alkylation response protein AidB-like acyl-CoA dehydrogenase
MPAMADRNCRRIGAMKEMVDAANLAWGNFPMLSHGAVKALKHHGEDWQKEGVPQAAGRRPLDRHHVPDRAALRHRSRPAEDPRRAECDGSTRITGTKIFITAGEHDLSETSCTWCWPSCPMRLPGAKGISLFVVPKFKVGKRRHAWASAMRALRLHRTQDGHPRLGHLRDELRRRRGLPDRRSRTRACRPCSP